MSTNISGTRLDGMAGFSPADVGGEAAPVRGEWNGLAVSVSDDPASLLADAAEELTFSASEKVEKDLSERKKPEKRERIKEVVPPPEVLQQMRERQRERLQKLLAEIKASGGNPVAFRQALDGFPDPTDRHAALLWLEEQLSDAPALAGAAAVERERLEAEAGPEIQAGYNIGGVDASGVGGPEEGRDAYRRTILGQGGISAMLEAILERCSGDGFQAKVDFLRLAVGVDLSAALPSIDKRELESMNNDLFQLRALGNFTREFGGDLDKLREKREKPPLPGAGLETLRLICKVKDERLIDLGGLASCLALERERDPSYDVLALTGAHNLIRRLPERLFAGEDSRQRLLAASQKLLDAAVDMEESMAEGEA
ncbi:MAG: type III secretion system gatekeeper subunit SctW [Planctomycetota bacterium]|jgi:type III secretion protein W|nr:type III secretion system gatekeeper subunit SctW [Planctomycetota bacterium]